MVVHIADDDEDLRTLIAEALRGDGHDVIEARNGADLLDHVEEAIADGKRLPTVIVSDVLMPKLSGLGVLSALRRARLNIPVILMTVLRDESVLTVARRLGSVALFRKPVDMHGLRVAVRTAQRLGV
jgi:two-component system response regulator (stage 0 sporulation protein F)